MQYFYDHITELAGGAVRRANQYGEEGWRWVNPEVVNGKLSHSYVRMVFEKEVPPKSPWVGMELEGSATA